MVAGGLSFGRMSDRPERHLRDPQISRHPWVVVWRLARPVVEQWPTIAGLALVVYGVALVYPPAAVIAGGLSLLLVDFYIRSGASR